MVTVPVLQANLQNMIEQNNKEHWEIKDVLIKLGDKFDKFKEELEKKMEENKKEFVTRIELKAVYVFVWVVATALAIIWFFTK